MLFVDCARYSTNPKDLTVATHCADRGRALRGILAFVAAVLTPRFKHCTYSSVQNRGLVRPLTSTSSDSWDRQVEMFFSAAFVLSTLFFLVAAAPFEEGSRDGISIPIAKRSGFRNADGVVDIKRLQAGLRRTVALVFYIFIGRLRSV